MKAFDMYLKFRKELDEICVPVILNCLSCVEYIVFDGETVGMVGGNPDYIDVVYVLPKYRRQGLAATAVKEWYSRYKSSRYPTRLHIINNNKVALNFWNNLFELKIVERNAVDTLYEIVREKYNESEKQIE